ncbi:hypothetical protein Q4567_18760 [Aliiglaciecola sp. 2_MG-2023]|uniref:hypothetical protein n=1 Tax=unclassified Aliiglaciecola TaxID=2593648 RepID=UPI0026E1E3DF|nr:MULTISPECIES: hypothetical protein [unclassified Aliiglaciecola]MDO6712782.1 hypothetical protein [Aliiglaciecola sp. 2_MG-2023]MDO6753819.1 hypothetical protein [Aliiglaciecola sp. 1_MG-2023]
MHELVKTSDGDFDVYLKPIDDETAEDQCMFSKVSHSIGLLNKYTKDFLDEAIDTAQAKYSKGFQLNSIEINAVSTEMYTTKVIGYFDDDENHFWWVLFESRLISYSVADIADTTFSPKELGRY